MGKELTQVKSETNISICINRDLLKKLLSSFISFLQNLGGEQSNISVTVTGISDGAHLKLCQEKAEWKPVDLMTFPPELLVGFLICYHHGGNIEIGTDSGVQFDIYLPDDPLTKTVLKPDDEVFDDIFDRYNIWHG